jgi:hypothetical protein
MTTSILPRTAGFRLLGLLTLLALGPAVAQACEPPDPDRVPVDRPITLYSDGSFIDASDDDDWYVRVAAPARDIGGGRVGQIIRWGYCDPLEYLLFVDCTTGSAVIVEGSTSTRALQPPYGPLALTSATTVADVVALSAREGWGVPTDVSEFASALGRRNRFDPFFGCKIYYPGSAGAGR